MVESAAQLMALKLVGAGLGRTGTHSLKNALEILLGAPCYHMVEVFVHPEHVSQWHAAARREPDALAGVFDGFAATVDWPGAAVWESIASANPEAVVLLSTRSDAAAWWKSANATIFEAMRRPLPPGWDSAWIDMVTALLRETFSPDFLDAGAAMAAYDAHNARVRATADPARLVEWQPGDGWEPLCTALGVAVPDEPFPHVNSTDEFRAMAGLDQPPA